MPIRMGWQSRWIINYHWVIRGALYHEGFYVRGLSFVGKHTMHFIHTSGLPAFVRRSAFPLEE